jgi:hypothetical protein
MRPPPPTHHRLPLPSGRARAIDASLYIQLALGTPGAAPTPYCVASVKKYEIRREKALISLLAFNERESGKKRGEKGPPPPPNI